jgi:hypothetical protein
MSQHERIEKQEYDAEEYARGIFDGMFLLGNPLWHHCGREIRSRRYGGDGKGNKGGGRLFIILKRGIRGPFIDSNKLYKTMRETKTYRILGTLRVLFLPLRLILR